MCTLLVYLPSSNFRAVPVFPATLKPCTRAFLPVPSLTATTNISKTLLAVLSFIALTLGKLGAPLTTSRETNQPPLAITLYALANWTVVTVIPYPNEWVACSNGCHFT